MKSRQHQKQASPQSCTEAAGEGRVSEQARWPAGTPQEQAKAEGDREQDTLLTLEPRKDKETGGDPVYSIRSEHPDRTTLAHFVNYAIVWLLVFRNPLTNRISFILILAAGLWTFLFARESRRRVDEIALFAGALLFGARTIGFLTNGSSYSVLAANALSPLANCVIFLYMLNRTVLSPEQVMGLLKQYGFARGTECALLGLALYFLPDRFAPIQQAFLSQNGFLGQIASDIRFTGRLEGFATVNPVNASLELSIVAACMLGCLLWRFSWPCVIMLIISTVANVLTWSRTGWVGGGILCLAWLVFAWKRKSGLSVLAPAALISVAGFTIALVFGTSLRERRTTDERLWTRENVDARFSLHLKYLEMIPDAGAFGYGVAAEDLAARSAMDISPENAYLETIMDSGIIGGLCFMFLLGLSFQRLLASRAIAAERFGAERSYGAAQFTLLALMLIAYPLIGTFLYEPREPGLWIIIGGAFSVYAYSQTNCGLRGKRSKHRRLANTHSATATDGVPI